MLYVDLESPWDEILLPLDFARNAADWAEFVRMVDVDDDVEGARRWLEDRGAVGVEVWTEEENVYKEIALYEDMADFHYRLGDTEPPEPLGYNELPKII